jgi:hypothetical protein
MNPENPFFERISPEKIINRIFHPNSPPNDLSSSEYSQKRLLNFEAVTFPHPAGYLTRDNCGKNCAFNLHFAKNRQNPQSGPNTAAIPQRDPPAPTSPPLSPQPPSISWPANRRWRPRSQRSKGRGKRRSHRP